MAVACLDRSHPIRQDITLEARMPRWRACMNACRASQAEINEIGKPTDPDFLTGHYGLSAMPPALKANE
jgi:hypothetical protein